MAAYRKLNRFVPFASNTVCDFTGFLKKSSEVIRQWDGLYGIPDAVSPRHPQDFAPTILPTQIFPNTRFEYPVVEGNYAIPNVDVFSSTGVAYSVTNQVVDSVGGVWSVDDDVFSSTGIRYPIFETALQQVIV